MTFINQPHITQNTVSTLEISSVFHLPPPSQPLTTVDSFIGFVNLPFKNATEMNSSRRHPLKTYYYFLPYVSECFASIYLCAPHAWCPWGPEDGVRSLGVGATGRSCPVSAVNRTSVLEEQLVLLTAEPALCPHSRRPLKPGFLHSVTYIQSYMAWGAHWYLC